MIMLVCNVHAIIIMYICLYNNAHYIPMRYALTICDVSIIMTIVVFKQCQCNKYNSHDIKKCYIPYSRKI